MAETKYVIFTLGNQKYGVKLERINGIEQNYRIVPIPVGTEHIRGIIHLREDVIPIFDLKGMFEIYDDSDVMNVQLLVAETHNIKIGIEVDNVIGIMTVTDENIRPVPVVVKAEDTDYIENVIKIKDAASSQDEIMLTVAIDNIMSEDDFSDVADALEDNE